MSFQSKCGLILSVCVLSFSAPAALAQDTFPGGGGAGTNYPQQPQPGGYGPQPGGGYPQQPGTPYGNNPGSAPMQQDPRAILQAIGPKLDSMMAQERQDFGVQATAQLHNGAFHGPTPTTLPGGQVITTKGVVELVLGQSMPYVLVDVLGAQQTLPGALPASYAAQPGSFNDQVQQQFANQLAQATQGRKDVPIILYCQSTYCWMSYNAALRAANAGYTNILWYRGGLEAWQSVGLPTMMPGQGQGQGQMQGQQGQMQPSRY